MDLPEVCVAYLLRPHADGGVDVLLGHKRTGLGLGRVVGIGGKVEPGESVTDAAVREIAEETGLVVDPADLRAVGLIDYLFPARRAWSQRSTVFVCTRWRGEPHPTDEIVPEWFDVAAIPFERMWDDAARWLPAVLHGVAEGVPQRLRATFTFGDDLATVVGERRAVA